MNKLLLSIGGICLGAMLFSCNRKTPAGATDTPTTGEVYIGVDESFSPMMDSQIYVFQSLYKKAKIHPLYQTETEIVNALLNDSLRVAVIARDLTDEEKKFFKDKTKPAFTTKIAVDAVALIIHPDNPDSMMTLDRVKNIFSGADTTWAGSKENITVVFDRSGSSNYRYIQRDLLQNRPMTKNTFAMKSNAEVVDYISKNKNALGVISVGWISDKRDTLAQKFLDKIRVVAISELSSPMSGEAYKKPYQAWIYDHTYPLRRDVYVIKLGTRSGLGTGFAAHLAGEKGQLIIHKQGMVAAQAPIRLVEINVE